MYTAGETNNMVKYQYMYVLYEGHVSGAVCFTETTVFEKEKVKCQERTEHSGSLYHLC